MLAVLTPSTGIEISKTCPDHIFMPHSVIVSYIRKAYRMSTLDKFGIVDAPSLIMNGNDSELSKLSTDKDDVDDTYQPEERGCALEDESSSEEEGVTTATARVMTLESNSMRFVGGKRTFRFKP